MEKKAGHTILFYMERVLKDDKGVKYANVQTDWIQFSNALAAAIDMKTVFAQEATRHYGVVFIVSTSYGKQTAPQTTIATSIISTVSPTDPPHLTCQCHTAATPLSQTRRTDSADGC